MARTASLESCFFRWLERTSLIRILKERYGRKDTNEKIKVLIFAHRELVGKGFISVNGEVREYTSETDGILEDVTVLLAQGVEVVEKIGEYYEQNPGSDDVGITKLIDNLTQYDVVWSINGLHIILHKGKKRDVPRDVPLDNVTWVGAIGEGVLALGVASIVHNEEEFCGFMPPELSRYFAKKGRIYYRNSRKKILFWLIWISIVALAFTLTIIANLARRPTIFERIEDFLNGLTVVTFIIGCVLKLSSGEEDFLLRTARGEELVPPGKELLADEKVISKLRRIELNLEATEILLNDYKSSTRENGANKNGMISKHGMLFEDYRSHIDLKVGNWVYTKTGGSKYISRTNFGYHLEEFSYGSRSGPHEYIKAEDAIC